MRTIWRRVPLGAAVTLLVVVALAPAMPPARAVAATTTVQAGQQNGGSAAALQYNAASITISAGDTVHWVVFPGTGAHTVTAFSQATPGIPDWNSGAITTTFDHVFTTPGTYTYYCSIHALRPQADPSVIDTDIAGGLMVGKVTVLPSSSVGGIAEAPDVAAASPLASRDAGAGTPWWRIALYTAGAALVLGAGLVVTRRAVRTR